MPATDQCLARNFYAIGDRILCIEGCDDWSLRETIRFIRGHHLEPDSKDLDRSRAHCRVIVRRGVLPSPSTAGQKSFALENGFCFVSEDSYHLEVAGSLILVRPNTNTVDVCFGDNEEACDRERVTSVLGYAIQAAMRQIGLYTLHAAGVVEPGSGAGFVIIGDSGSGKSTLTIQLASQGWLYLSDDTLVLGESSQEARIWALRRAFTISCATPRRYGWSQVEEAMGETVWSDPAKRWFDPNRVFPDRLAQACTPRALLFSTVTGDQVTRVERIEKGEAMMNLVNFCPWTRFDPFNAREHLRALSLMVNQSSSYMFYAGQDILNEPEQASRLLLESTI
jgi:hypothetical protein